MATVNEGKTVFFTLSTESAYAGKQYSYQITGVDASDVVGGQLSGTATIDANGRAQIAVSLVADATTEGAETLTLTAAGQTASVVVNDTSVTPAPVVPTYTLSAVAASANEGGTAVFALDTTNVAAGSKVGYVLSGVSAADIVGGQLTGEVTVGADGKAYISVNLVADATTEGAETLTVTAAGQTASVVVNDTSAAPAAQTSFIVSAADIAASNVLQGANAVIVDVGSSGAKSVTLPEGITSDGGFVIAGGASDVTVTSGAQNDTITLVSEGNNTISTGAGNDTVTVIGTGTNTINVGAGADTVTGGSGNNTIVFGSGALGAGDTVTGGLGNDTVVISGDGNVIGGAGATLTGVEAVVMNGTKVTITGTALAALSSISGHADTSEVTVDVVAGDTLDLSATSVSGLKSITADDNVTIKLSAEQIAEIGTITTAAGKNLTVNTSVEGLLLLGTKAAAGTGGTLAVTITDTVENIAANSAAIAAAGATPVVAGSLTVAQAVEALAAASTSTFALADTAANLALAPNSVFANANSLAVTTSATAVEAQQIKTVLAAVANASLVAATVTFNVVDTADAVANNYAGAALADSVTTTGASTAAQAIATYTATGGAVYSIVDTAVNLDANKAANAFDHATSIAASNALTVAQVDAINAASTVDLTSGYALSDSFANLVTGTSTSAVIAAAVTAAAGNITVTGNLTVAQALQIEALSNTGANSYALSDAIATLLAASGTVTANASAAAPTEAAITAAQANSLLAKFGSTHVGALVVTDTAANLLTLSADAIAKCAAADINITAATTATVAQALSLNTLLGAKLDKATVDVSDTAANILAATADATNVVVMDDFHSIAISGNATMEQVLAINADLTAETTGGAGLTAVAGGYTISDTFAHIYNANAAAEAAAVDAAGVVIITDPQTVANVQISFLDYTATGDDPTLGTQLVYSLNDTAANILAGGVADYAAAATSISITDASVSGATAADLVALTKFDGVYTISGDVADLLTNAVNNGVTASVKQNAVSVELRDTVAHLEAGSSAALAITDLDTIVIADTLTNIGAAAAATITAAASLVVSDNNLTVANAAAVNALTKPATYNVVDAYADFITAGAPASEAIGTMLANATTVTLSDATTTVAQFNVIDALTSGSIKNNAAITGTTLTISDTIANLGTANAAAAAAAATTVTASNIGAANATVAQAELLLSYGVNINGLDIVDTSANIQGMSAALLAAVVAANAAGTLNDTTITSSDNAHITASVALAHAMFDVTGAAAETDGSSYANYSLSDTAANLVAAAANLLNFAQAVTATTAATAAQGATLVARTTMGTPVEYSLSDTATALAAQVAALNGAVNITATGTAATIAEAITLNAATNSGTTSYSIGGTAASFVSNVPATQATISAAVEAATGTVTATTDATFAEAAVIAGLTKAVTYSISDVAANVANATTAGLNEAVNIAVTTALNAANAATFLAATNSGTTTLTAVTDTAANVLGLNLTSNDVITTLTVSGAVSAADAATIAAKDTGANIGGAVVFSGTISGTAAEIAAIPDAVLAAAGGVTATAMSMAQYNALAAAITIANVDHYSLVDTFANFMVDTAPDANVDAKAVITAASSATCTDNLNVAQATDFVDQGGDVYNVVDTDANIAASLGANTIVTGAASVSNGTVTLDIQSIGAAATTVISGTKAEISALSSTLQAENVAYEVSVADLVNDANFYASLGAGKYISVTDTAENLTSGNALLALAKHIVVTDTITAAQYTAIAAVSAADDMVYSLSDTAANLAGLGNAVLAAATSAVATTSATALQAQTLDNDATFSIVDTAANFANFTASASNATNITVSGSLTAANATTIIGYTNAGTTSIETVTGTPAALTTLAGLLNASTTVTNVTPDAALTVVQATTMVNAGATITAYSLSDTAANLAAASSSILNNATNIALSGGVATVAQATIIDGATNSGTTTYAVSDTAANVLAASVTVLEHDSDDHIVVTDTSVTAATATALRAFDAANNDVVATAAVTEGFDINAGGAAGVFTISDTYANLTLAANAAAVNASTNVTATDAALSVAQAVTLNAATGADAAPAMSVTDTYTNLVVNHAQVAAIPMSATTLTVSGTMSVAQAKVIAGYNALETTMVVRDTAANVAASVAHEVVVGSSGTASDVNTTVSISNAATVAQAATLEGKLTGGYAIADTAAAVYTALNTVNGAVGTADRGLLEGASSVTVSGATVAQALGVAAYGTETRGLYTMDNVTYSISDTVTNMIAGLSGIDAAGISAATSLNASDTTAMSVANAATLTSLSNFQGYDDGSTALVVEHNYYISDTAINVMAADTALINGATTVAVSGTANADIIDLSMHSKAMTITGGAGVDDITGGTGNDKFVFATEDIDSTAGAVTDIIENFGAGTDTIGGSFGSAAGAGVLVEAGDSVADLSTLLSAADTALDGTVKYYVGQITNGDVYVVSDSDGQGYTDVIKLVGVTLATFDGTVSIVA